MTINAQKLIVEGCRNVLVPIVIEGKALAKVGRQEREMARAGIKYVTERGSAPSVNMFGLSRAAGHAMGMVSDDELLDWLAGEIRCSWYRRHCGVANEQAICRTHAVLNVVPITYAAQLGFEDAAFSLGRTFRFVLEVDPFKTGRAIATGARSSRGERADFGDDAARALRGEKLRRGNTPSAQDVCAVIQEEFPELISDAANFPLPPLRYATVIERYEHGLVTRCPDAPGRGTNRYGTVALTWYVVAGNRVVRWADECEPPWSELGAPVSTISTPTGVIPE